MILPLSEKIKSEIFAFDKKFTFRFVNEDISLGSAEQKIISTHWKNAQTKNPHLFNGKVLVISNIKNENLITLNLKKTNYDHFLASECGLLKPEIACRSIYVSVLIETDDKKIAIGKMGLNSFEPGRYQFIGGGLNLNHVTGTTIDFEKCITEELEEELGIKIDEHKAIIKSFKPMFLSLGKIKQKVSIVFILKLKIASSDLENMLLKHNENIVQRGITPEVEKLMFLDKNTVCFFTEGNTFDENLFSSLHSYFSNRVQTDYSIIK